MATVKALEGIYHARFRYQGRQYRRSLKTDKGQVADNLLHLIEYTLGQLASGRLAVPPDVDPGDFILSGGVLKPSPQAVAAAPSTTLRSAIQEYKASRFAVSQATLVTEGIHLKHLETTLAAKLDEPLSLVSQSDLLRHLQARYVKVAADTVLKERATISSLFKWATAQGHLGQNPAADLPRLKGAAERPPFRTKAEIEAIIARGGLSAKELARIWEGLYLQPHEIAELLQLVRSRAKEDFEPLLHEIPAYTGMRRGEVRRLRWCDVDFEHGYILARSAKQSRQSREVVRHIDMHPDLKAILLAWREKRRLGQYVVGPRKMQAPLDAAAANRAFRRPLLGTSWCLHRRKRKFKLGFHTYRHSFASNLAAEGVDQRLIDEFMGHTTEAMRKRYRHLVPKVRRSAIERLQFSPAASSGIAG